MYTPSLVEGGIHIHVLLYRSQCTLPYLYEEYTYSGTPLQVTVYTPLLVGGVHILMYSFTGHRLLGAGESVYVLKWFWLNRIPMQSPNLRSPSVKFLNFTIHKYYRCKDSSLL